MVIIKKDQTKKSVPPLKNIENQEMPKITSVQSLKPGAGSGPVTQFRAIRPRPSPVMGIGHATITQPNPNPAGPAVKKTVIINPRPTTDQVDDWRELRLSPKAKGSFIFVYWRVLRGLVQTGRVKIFAYQKTKQVNAVV